MKINEKDISVVIPMYNSEQSISKVLTSIINQTYSAYIAEIIVINDGSTDNSRQIVEAIRSNSSLKINLVNCKNGGVSRARNIGLSKVKTKWIALCDSDDEWMRDKIEHQVRIINSKSDIDFLGGNHVPWMQKYFLKKIDRLRRISIKDLCMKILPQTSTAIFRKKIFEEIGGYDEKQNYAEDGNFFMKIAAKYKYYYDPKQVVIYGDGKNGFGESGLSANIGEMHKGIEKNLKEMYEKGYISKLFLMLSLLLEKIKYLRRKIKVKNI